MSQNKHDAFVRLIQILLGVVLGVLLTLSYNKYQESRRGIKVMDGEWRKLNLILDVVEKNYVDTINASQMTEAAVTAALHKLDPHSLYMPPVEKKESESQLAGNFEGIGIQFNVPNDTAIVLEVIAGGPSEKAGLMVGDRLLKVDDKMIAGVGFPQDSMVRRMKGPAGTKVNITVKRGHDEVPFEITRGRIPVHSVDAHFMVNDTTGYIRVSKFAATTFPEFMEAAVDLRGKGMKSIILDLRDNSGGFLEQAAAIANEFLYKGEKIVYIEGRHRKRRDINADGNGSLQKYGIIVLINENSASASEILAGAIQDNDRGVIIGRRSFGKGLVQEPVDFSDGSGLRLTVARYYTPSGRCIQKPYSDYDYDIYNRYTGGEVFSADSAKLNKDDVHLTLGGREVYGGGGIMPDVFVPIDTTRASAFFVSCNKKATQMRYASSVFDRYFKSLSEIDDYETLDSFLKRADLPSGFRRFASSKDGIVCSDEEYSKTLQYLEPQLNALVARYSKLGDNAFYKYYLPVDETVKIALQTSPNPHSENAGK